MTNPQFVNTLGAVGVASLGYPILYFALRIANRRLND